MQNTLKMPFKQIIIRPKLVAVCSPHFAQKRSKGDHKTVFDECTVLVNTVQQIHLENKYRILVHYLCFSFEHIIFLDKNITGELFYDVGDFFLSQIGGKAC